ncbi:MAG TPA: hypothetical protein VJT73_15340 [Polyangiaceae bacterium]|nr:hypothetical protein [Polyangiaceae bacterium]
MRGQTVFPFFQPPVGRMRRGRLNAKIAPRMAPAAVRVPNPVHAPQIALQFPQSFPQIFVHEGARQTFERRLRSAFPGPVLLAVTDNRHSMVSYARRGGILRARVHMMFLDAPAPVQEALCRYIVRGDRNASQIVGRYIDANGHRIKATRPVLTPLATKGQHHDLLTLFHDVNSKYFGGTVDALVSWGRSSPPRRNRATIKLGSYSAVERLIRIHPSLDRSWVPRYFVQFIIYHEMLHHVIPASRGPGRALLHPSEFRRREEQFRHYERAMQWERAHIGRILRA